MTDIEQKALALVNEAHPYTHWNDIRDVGQRPLTKALCRAIEQRNAAQAEFDAFRQEVSDAVEAAATVGSSWVKECLSRFIIAKPDPLVEAMRDACSAQGLAIKHTPGELTEHLRAAIEKRGGKIVWGEG